jgi:hypothetical protein
MPGDTEPARAGPSIPAMAHSARVHDYWLGGKDNFAADRAAGELQEPGVVAVQQWRPGSDLEARARSAMWGAVARKP